MAPSLLPPHAQFASIVGSSDVSAWAFAVKAWDLAAPGTEVEAARQAAQLAAINFPSGVRFPSTFAEFHSVCGTALQAAHNASIRAGVVASDEDRNVKMAEACRNVAQAHIGTFGSRFSNISGIVRDVAAVALPVAIAALGPAAIVAWNSIGAATAGPAQQQAQAVQQLARDEIENPAGTAEDRQRAASILTGGFFSGSVGGIPVFVLILAAIALLLFI